MYLVEILLLTADNHGRRFDDRSYADVRDELTERFGGLTAFTRAPAQGIVQNDGETVHEDIVVLEVMTQTLDHDWWRAYRSKLEEIFHQEEIVIRATAIERL